MITLFEKNETAFNTIGIGVLKDAIECIVTEELNGSFELEMTYPITGSHYKDILFQRIILASPNSDDNPQPFRIYSITKPIDGKVKINAEHISYDTIGYIVKRFSALNLGNTISKLNSESFPACPFVISTDKVDLETTMETDKPYSLRALLLSETNSILDIYGGEYKFDKFNIQLLKARGADRGLTFRYGKNITDLESKKSSENVYTGIFPFYSATISKTTSQTVSYFQPVYIVSNSVAYASNWLGFIDGEKAFTPLIESTPIQIMSAGIYYEQIVFFKKATIENTIDCYIKNNGTELQSDWLSLIDGGDVLIPEVKRIYKIISNGDYNLKTYIWDSVNNAYVEFSGNGFYYTYEEVGEDVPVAPLSKVQVNTVEEYNYLDLTEDPNYQNGIIIIEGHETDDPKRILNVDLSDKFSDVPTINILKEAALSYLEDLQTDEPVESLSISFIKLSYSDEYLYLKEFEKVKLGDYVSIIYNDLDVNSKLQVISVEYDVISERYNEINLGTKKQSLINTAVTVGDGVSSLKNDVKYADAITVLDIFTTNMTANYIEGKNAKLSEAQITQLTTERIVSNLIQASSANIDNLIAILLTADSATIKTLISVMITADNAEIKNLLKSGTVEVSGKITAESGKIGAFDISSDGLEASLEDADTGKITDIKINPDILQYGEAFKVYQSGSVQAKSFNVLGFGRLFKEKTTIECYTRSLGQMYSQDWLSLTDNGDILTPSINDVYQILSGLFSGKSYIWNNENSRYINVDSNNIIECYIRPESNPYTQNWLSITIDGAALQPQIDSIYKILSIGELVDRYYIWDGYNSIYIETGKNNIITTVQTEINDGKLHADHVFFSDEKKMYIKQNDDSVKHQTVVCNLYIISRTVVVGGPDIVKVGFVYNIYDKNGIIQQNSNLFKPIQLEGKLRITYAPILFKLPKIFSFSTDIQISDNNPLEMIFENSIFDGASSISIYDFSPKTIFEVDGVEDAALVVNLDLIPEEYEDSLGNKIMPSLGSEYHKWENIYTKNGIINTSDKKVKRDINYDISIYEKFFDDLKPTSFKFKNNNETHLGLIAQDVEKSLIKCGLNNNNFSGLVKTIKKDSKNKPTNELSDSDYIYGLNYSELYILMISEIQSLKKKIKCLEEEIKGGK